MIYIQEYLKNRNYIVLVNDDNAVNGFLLIYKNVDCYELEAIVTDKDYQGKGIANNLISYFINNYTNKDDSILLEVAINNTKAIKLYKKYDFKIINTRKKYYNGIDAYIMKKVIE